jgi:hypothetical protein
MIVFRELVKTRPFKLLDDRWRNYVPSEAEAMGIPPLGFIDDLD